MDSTTTAELVRCTTLVVVGCIDTSSSGVIDFVDEHYRMVCCLFTAITISHLVYYPTMIEVLSKRFYASIALQCMEARASNDCYSL